MNSQREIFKSSSLNSQIKISPEWFIGFWPKGEGTFGIKLDPQCIYKWLKIQVSIV